MENTVIIIGADHHNTLAAIRAFGQEGCKIKVVILDDEKKRRKISVFMSKYVHRNNSYIIGANEAELLKFLQINADISNKPILFPTSDFAEAVIDKNYAELSKNFILPGFEGKAGEVLRSMDKWEQYQLAVEHNIPMAPTFLVYLSDIQIPEELEFPCIVKPRTSAYGAKDDIEICEDEGTLYSALSSFAEKGYTDALVQVFVAKIYEALSLGCITSNGKILGGTIIKLREQLESATSFSRFVIDNSENKLLDGAEMYEELNKVNGIVLDMLKVDGYHGQYDVEYFICDNAVYFNEINYRHSGMGYALINDHINAPYMWALSCVGEKDTKHDGKIKLGAYMMAELFDKMYVKRRVLTLKEWIRDIKRTDYFAVYNKNDKLMAFRVYFKTAVKLVKRGVKAALGRIIKN